MYLYRCAPCMSILTGWRRILMKEILTWVLWEKFELGLILLGLDLGFVLMHVHSKICNWLKNMEMDELQVQK